MAMPEEAIDKLVGAMAEPLLKQSKWQELKDRVEYLRSIVK